MAATVATPATTIFIIGLYPQRSGAGLFRPIEDWQLCRGGLKGDLPGSCHVAHG